MLHLFTLVASIDLLLSVYTLKFESERPVPCTSLRYHLAHIWPTLLAPVTAILAADLVCMPVVCFPDRWAYYEEKIMDYFTIERRHGQRMVDKSYENKKQKEETKKNQ